MAQRLFHTSLPFPLCATKAFAILSERSGCVWLDSARSNPHGDGNWSLLAAEPTHRLRYTDGVLERITYDDESSPPEAPANSSCQPQTVTTPRQQTQILDQDPLQALEAMLAELGCGQRFNGPSLDEADKSFAKPFFSNGGGAIGYFSYEFGRSWEEHDKLPSSFHGFPQMDWGFYNKAIIFDHSAGTACLIACSQQSLYHAQQIAQHFLNSITCCAQAADSRQNASARSGTAPATATVATSLAASCTNSQTASNSGDFATTHTAQRQQAYMEAVQRLRSFIAQGDIYQTNIAQYFSAPLREPPPALYQRLRRLNPAPYAAYIDTGAYQILSSSPELFLQKRGSHVRTRPIKGTRPRGNTPQQDAALKEALLASDKERAELLMIVDLERNDLGRVCRIGSVNVDALYRIETYATVHHLVADVSGTLTETTSLRDLLRATFPGGSITGAPKVRSMQIIDELEGRERGIFCGAVGALGFDGSVDLNIAIRTLLCAPAAADTASTEPAAYTANTEPPANQRSEKVLHLGVGAGLVWDSDPLHEYEETLHKAQALLEAIHSQNCQ